MKDFIGIDIAVNDIVVLIQPNYRRLIMAKIVEIRPWKDTFRAKVKFIEKFSKDYERVTELLQESNQLVKVDGPDAVAYNLRNAA